jgi:hypothetical protein
MCSSFYLCIIFLRDDFGAGYKFPTGGYSPRAQAEYV